MPHNSVKFWKGGEEMVSPFEVKNRLATRIDRFALGALVLALCLLHFYRLWRSLPESLIAGLATFLLILLTVALFERSTLARRDRALRERLGGMIALDDLLLLPGAEACKRTRDMLILALDASPVGDNRLLSEGEVWLVRLAQCMRGSGVSEGDVLSAHRARQEEGAAQCILCSTGGVSPAAVRAAEWVDPPVRLISGAQLAALFGRLHPASDADIARHLSRQKKPYSFSRMRLLALSPAKQKKYLLCSFLLLCFYLVTASLPCLISCLLAFTLALLCKKENSRVFRL